MELFKQIFMIFAGVGVFLIGLNTIGGGLERAFGKGMRKLLNKLTSNRFAGVGVGAGVTGIIQSSGATTVMVIGFVNAGLMTLFQATSVIMGANIGTTVTGILVSLKDLPVKQVMAATAFIGGMMMILGKRDRTKNIGNIFAGLGLIFVGLDLTGNTLENSEVIKGWIMKAFTVIDFPLVLILVGIILTALIHSSSAATGIIITLITTLSTSGEPLLSFYSAMYIILGTNIGTCLTAIMASFGAQINAKRAACIHLLFNVIGTIIFTIVILIFGRQIDALFTRIFVKEYGMMIAWFHVIFNLSTTLLLLPFIKQLVWLAEHLVKPREKDEIAMHLFYLDDRILETPPIAVAQVLKETSNMARIAQANVEIAVKGLITGEIDLEGVYKTEKQINFINRGIQRYLVKISSLNLSRGDENLIGALHHVVSDIERIGDHAENLAEFAEKMNVSGIIFSEDAKQEIRHMFKYIKLMGCDSLYVFEKRDQRFIEDVKCWETMTDKLNEEYSNNHIKRLKDGLCTAESGELFFGVLANLERIADHLNNIALSVRPLPVAVKQKAAT